GRGFLVATEQGHELLADPLEPAHPRPERPVTLDQLPCFLRLAPFQVGEAALAAAPGGQDVVGPVPPAFAAGAALLAAQRPALEQRTLELLPLAEEALHQLPLLPELLPHALAYLVGVHSYSIFYKNTVRIPPDRCVSIVFRGGAGWA